MMGGFFGSRLANFLLWAAGWQLVFISLVAILLAVLAGGAPPFTESGRRVPLLLRC